MDFIKGRLPARQIAREFEWIQHREVAANRRIAESVAKQELAKKARALGGNAVMEFIISPRRIFTGHEIIVSGIAIKKR